MKKCSHNTEVTIDNGKSKTSIFSVGYFIYKRCTEGSVHLILLIGYCSFYYFILVHCPKYCTHKVELHFSRSINFYLINDEVECVKHLHPASANQLRTSIRLKYTKIKLNVQVNGDLFCVVRISKYGLNTTLDDRSNYLQTLSFSLLLQYYYYYYYCY